MGDRASIVVRSKDFAAPIQFYGHWSGGDNVNAVTDVLTSTQRVGDSGYLAAQLFHQFAAVLGGYDGVASQTGFGIYPVPDGLDVYMGWEDNPTVFIDADTGSVEYLGETYGINAVVRGDLYVAQRLWANGETSPMVEWSGEPTEE